MSHDLAPLSFPLHGSRLIEASAGTGKTWTIAALYLRLVLGHGEDNGFVRPLLPSEILVMTFTRAATQELSKRIRDRLLEAARCFRGEEPAASDSYLRELIAEYAAGEGRSQAAYRLMLAAESMDEAAVFTIDAWCQRMLREHAFDSGSLFDEELVSDQAALFEHAVRDYWRQHVYTLNIHALQTFRLYWSDVTALEAAVKDLIKHADLFGPRPGDSLLQLIERIKREQLKQLEAIKHGWAARLELMEAWIEAQRVLAPKGFSATKFKAATVTAWFTSLRLWATTPEMVAPEGFAKFWEKLTPEKILAACNKDFTPALPEDFALFEPLKLALDTIEPIQFALLRHAVSLIAQRMDMLKLGARQFGFADMLQRLKSALEGENGAALQSRITMQYPVALIDEFQDTSPDQYAIFDALYKVAANDRLHGLFLIGDPKQSIYGFRGADIHSYLSARSATAGRHYLLSTNYRSTKALVTAVNTLFAYAEGEGERSGFSAGAFKFRRGGANPLPFHAVTAHARAETFVGLDGSLNALTFWCYEQPDMNKNAYLDFFAKHCAEHIVQLLNDASVGFKTEHDFVRLQPADIAILVKDRHEAAAIRKALQRRNVASVYLSDKDSVINSDEAADILRWLHAVSNPLNSGLARAAYASKTAGFTLAKLALLAADDRAWETCVEQLKGLHALWQRQGILAMLRKLIHDLALPARLLNEMGGERVLTNLLHLAEILQTASEHLDGEQSLIRWLTEQIESDSGDGEERVLRLESDAELVKVCTVHKSKGLEYPLVFLPFAVSARPASKKNRSFFEYVDADGMKTIDLSLSAAAQAAVEAARMEEDLRLLYVALTRARHALWLGVASLKNKIHESALGYLLAGGQELTAAALCAAISSAKDGCASIQLDPIAAEASLTRLSRADVRPALIDAPTYTAKFEHDWSVGSFSSLTRAMVATTLAARIQDNKEQNGEDRDDANLQPLQAQNAAWHRFPAGSRVGQFLHAQLEWMGNEGFSMVDADNFSGRFMAKCERAGWAKHQDDALAWLSQVSQTTLLPIGVSLQQLDTSLPEMEFWFPSERLITHKLDLLCRERLLDAIPRAAIPERDLHGILMGFVDLVFVHEGKYWLLDYKSNYIGPDDASYHQQALTAAMAAHRYDMQAAIYMLALHRLLKKRLGVAYSAETHLGGAIFFFLRGIAHADTHGCYHISPTNALMDELDQLFSATALAT
jgi:exodeoxyribonuclease V beta subunit